jgi:hypothetical protein
VELDPRQHQGLFGETFVRALASAAGLVVAKAELDVTGEDFTISCKGVVAGKRHPKIDVQIKSWSSPAGAGTTWSYPMLVKHFNELAGTDYSLPRFLILVIVPKQRHQYALAKPSQLVLNHSAYWVSLHDYSRIDPTTQTSVTVHVPKANLVTAQVLQSLMATPLPVQVAG